MRHSIFQTERLYVRRFDLTDEENFFRLNSDQDVMRYIRKVKDREESRHFLLQNIDAYAKSPMTGRWAVHEKEGDLFVGTFAIIPLENTSYWQVGYALLKDYWGRGYATELTQTGVEFAFRNLMVSRLAAVTEISNDASRHVLAKTGFKQLDNFIQDGKELCLFETYNPAVVETRRLLIAALDKHQLDLYLAHDNRLENELGLKTGDRVLSQDLREMLEQITVPMMQDATEQNYFFHTLWVVIDKAENRLVGELGFKGVPGAGGEVEIGYGTFPLFQGQGFMTEAVGGLLGWARQFPGLTTVTAETERKNQPSISVLRKNGFELVGKRNAMLVWKCRFEEKTPELS